MSSPAEKPVQKKKTAPPAHPLYKDMIIAAIAAVKDRKGTSRQAIVKYVVANYKVGDNAGKLVGNGLKKGVESGVFVLADSRSRFKLSEATKTAAIKSKKPANKPAKKPVAKKPSAAKTAKPRKPAAKTTTKKSTKTTTKKSTKSPAKKPKSPAKTKKPAAKSASKKAGKKATPKKGLKKPAAKKATKAIKK